MIVKIISCGNDTMNSVAMYNEYIVSCDHCNALFSTFSVSDTLCDACYYELIIKKQKPLKLNRKGITNEHK